MIKIIIHSVQQNNNNKYREIFIKDSNIVDEKKMVQLMLSYLFDYIHGNEIPSNILEQLENDETYILYGNILYYTVWDMWNNSNKVFLNQNKIEVVE